MTEPRRPPEPNDGPVGDASNDGVDDALAPHEELALDLIDGVAPSGTLDGRADASALTTVVSDHERVIAAVGEPVEAPELVRERALRAAMAAHEQEDDRSTAETAPRSRPGRSAGRVATWVLPALGAAAAILLVVGVTAAIVRGGYSSSTATSSSSQDASASRGGAVAGSAPDLQSQDLAARAAGGGADFGVANTQEQLAANVANRFLTAPATPSAAESTPPTTPVGDSATTAVTNTYDAASGAATASGPVPCEAAARALRPALANAPILTAGTAEYQSQPAYVIAFADRSAGPQGYLVALSTADCRVLVQTGF